MRIVSVSMAFRRGGWLQIRIPAAEVSPASAFDHFLNNSLLLPMFELRIHWQRQNFRRRPFCYRKISYFVPQSRIRRLKVERCRVVDLRCDVSLGEMRLKVIPIL